MSNTSWHLKHELYGSKPWSVQTEALRRADGRPKWGHFLEQGLGKTPLTLNEFVNSDEVEVAVVIAPNSFKLDWALAPAEWGVGFIQTGIWPRDEVPHQEECALYAVNYEAVRPNGRHASQAYKQLEHLLKYRRCLLIIDESKAICNDSSKTTRAVLELAKLATMVRLLNGTPMTENVGDYYPQLRALGELDGVKATNFRNRYAAFGGYMGKQLVGINEDRRAELGAILDACTFRALKSDWRKDLPPQVQQTVHVEMTDRQRKHYDEMMDEFMTIVGDTEITAGMVITQMIKAAQITAGVVMHEGEEHVIEPAATNPKFKALLDIMNTGSGKTIVSYMHKAVGRMLMDGLKEYQPARIAGGMKAEQVVAEKARFNNDPDCRVIITQQIAGARGHTLLGQKGKDRCNKIVFIENHQGLYWREQIKDRNHRGEQDEQCTLFDLVASPMDQIFVDTLVRKKNLADSMDQILDCVRSLRK